MMTLQQLLDQLRALDLEKSDEVSSFLTKMQQYFANITNEISQETKAQNPAKADKIVTEAIKDDLALSEKLLENFFLAKITDTSLLDECLAKVNHLAPKGKQIELTMLKDALQTYTDEMQEKSGRYKKERETEQFCDVTPSITISQDDITKLEEEKKSQPPRSRNAELEGSCRELDKIPHLFGENSDLHKLVPFEAKKLEKSASRLKNAARVLTSNEGVAQRFSRRFNMDGFTNTLNTHLGTELGNNLTETKLDALMKSGNYVNKLGSNKVKFEQEALTLFPDQESNVQRIYCGKNGELYYREIIAYDKLLTSVSTGHIGRVDKKPFFYTDTILKIGSDKETIVSSRIIPCDDLAYTCLGLKKEDAVVRPKSLDIIESSVDGREIDLNTSNRPKPSTQENLEKSSEDQLAQLVDLAEQKSIIQDKINSLKKEQKEIEKHGTHKNKTQPSKFSLIAYARNFINASRVRSNKNNEIELKPIGLIGINRSDITQMIKSMGAKLEHVNQKIKLSENHYQSLQCELTRLELDSESNKTTKKPYHQESALKKHGHLLWAKPKLDIHDNGVQRELLSDNHRPAMGA